ncbi:Threonylcarbamoyl-AMP synthase [Buchnera aphidicola (Takecallis arundicolens)]|uniref:Sua5/YciO/YrdC/YwlC family protein n=1 Tax=Buchnera aphidicola TaxID=9 RepID=UPI003464A114
MLKTCHIYTSLLKCIDFLNKNYIIAYPTEAVFALGCNPDSDDAIINLLKLKNRSKRKGLILVAASYNQLIPYINECRLSDFQKQKIFSLYSGFITFLVPARSNISNWITGFSNLVAVRVTKHPVVKRLCLYYGKPIISTSANFTGMPESRTVKDVLKYFGSDIPILDGNIGNFLYPSKIFNILTGEYVRNAYSKKI